MLISNLPYYKDKDFLKEIDNKRNATVCIKVTILNWLEKPVEEVTGKLLPGGSINKDGNSSVRRTANLSFIVDDLNMSYDTLQSLFSINKKITIDIGIINDTKKYKEYDILWFPQGLYLIMQANLTHNLTSTQISLNLKDKMVLLNGEVGGRIPASVCFSEMEYTDEKGQTQIIYPTLFQIIMEAVNHFGGEQLGKILIEDLDLRIKKVMKWNDSTRPVYKYINSQGRNELTTDYNTIPSGTYFDTYECGEDIGYVYDDFTWVGEDLIGDVGSTVCDVLDKIKDLLGNFEYFYDIDGNFRFREIKNYLNNSQAKIEIENLNKENYLIDLSKGKIDYQFTSTAAIINYQNNPQYEMIKNDFVVWGMRETADGTKLPIRYHLVIDDKPQLTQHNVYIYKDKTDDLTKAMGAIQVDDVNEIEDPQPDTFYYTLKPVYVMNCEVGAEEDKEYTYSFEEDDTRTRIIYYETGIVYKYNYKESKVYRVDFDAEDCMMEKGDLYSIHSQDWRTELYLQGVEAISTGIDAGYYFPELKAEWPKIYDIVNGQFYDWVLANPSALDWFLDFIDSSSGVGHLSVQNIGRRIYTTSNEKVNCVFEDVPPDWILIEAGQDNTSVLVQEAVLKNEEVYRVPSDIYKNIVTGGKYHSAFYEVRILLYTYTSFCENVVLQCIPIYYLDVNTRIGIEDKQINIYGDFMINRITLPLDYSGTMSITATKALERI